MARTLRQTRGGGICREGPARPAAWEVTVCVCRASRAGRALGLCGWTRPLRPSALPPASTPALPAHWSHPSLSPDTACNFLQSTGRRCGNTGTQCADEFTCPRKRAFNQTCPSSPGDTAQGFLGSSQQDPQPTALRPQERAGLRGPGRQWAPWGSSDPGPARLGPCGPAGRGVALGPPLLGLGRSADRRAHRAPPRTRSFIKSGMWLHSRTGTRAG